MTDVVFIPSVSPNHQLGATMLLAWLAFPIEPVNRAKFLDYVNAKRIKSTYKRNSPERKQYQYFTKIPNKKINQFLEPGKKGAGYRLNIRKLAAQAMWEKIHSHPDPMRQDSLKHIAHELAAFNSSEYPAFENADSFIKNVIWRSRPVLHLAMAITHNFYLSNISNDSIVDIVDQTDLWLDETLRFAEIIRVSFDQWLPDIKMEGGISFLPKLL